MARSDMASCPYWNADGEGSLCCHPANGTPECHPASCPEMDRLRKDRNAFHRRAQTAEALLPKWQEVRTKNFITGHLARCMLRMYCQQEHDRAEELQRRLNRACAIWQRLWKCYGDGQEYLGVYADDFEELNKLIGDGKAIGEE